MCHPIQIYYIAFHSPKANRHSKASIRIHKAFYSSTWHPIQIRIPLHSIRQKPIDTQGRRAFLIVELPKAPNFEALSCEIKSRLEKKVWAVNCFDFINVNADGIGEKGIFEECDLDIINIFVLK